MHLVKLSARRHSCITAPYPSRAQGRTCPSRRNNLEAGPWGNSARCEGRAGLPGAAPWSPQSSQGEGLAPTGEESTFLSHTKAESLPCRKVHQRATCRGHREATAEQRQGEDVCGKGSKKKCLTLCSSEMVLIQGTTEAGGASTPELGSGGEEGLKANSNRNGGEPQPRSRVGPAEQNHQGETAGEGTCCTAGCLQ